MFSVYLIVAFVIFTLVVILLAPVYICRGLWMAGFRFGGIMVATLLGIGYVMEFTYVARSLFPDNWYDHFITTKSLYFLAGLITTGYAIVILRHMLFSKTMPWAGEQNKKSERSS